MTGIAEISDQLVTVAGIIIATLGTVAVAYITHVMSKASGPKAADKTLPLLPPEYQAGMIGNIERVAVALEKQNKISAHQARMMRVVLDDLKILMDRFDRR